MEWETLSSRVAALQTKMEDVIKAPCLISVFVDRGEWFVTIGNSFFIVDAIGPTLQRTFEIVESTILADDFKERFEKALQEQAINAAPVNTTNKLNLN
jgi:hypothetical protein